MVLTFDVASSRELPDKVQLEIRDGSGRIVFKKRQNVYYVKLQEKIAALDANRCTIIECSIEKGSISRMNEIFSRDYFLELKAITGPEESIENVTIFHKGYVPDIR